MPIISSYGLFLLSLSGFEDFVRFPWYETLGLSHIISFSQFTKLSQLQSDTYHSRIEPSGPKNSFGCQGSVSLLICRTRSSSISIPRPGLQGAST